MPEITSYPPNTPSWVDLASADVAASAAFYTGLFGWTAGEPSEEGGGYAMFLIGDKAVAGLAPIMMEGQPPSWTCYVSVEDADKTAELVGTNGGQVFLPPMDVLDVGRMAVFADPTGAAFAIWQPRAHIGAQLAGEPNTFCWAELSSRDTATAAPFYSAVFGWEPKPAMEGSYTTFHLGDTELAGMMDMPEMVPAEVPSYWLPYFAVADTDATVAAAKGLGASVLVEPTDIPPGRFAVFMDPQGVSFAVIALAG